MKLPMRGLTVGTAGLPVNLIKQQKAYLSTFPPPLDILARVAARIGDPAAPSLP